MSSAWPDPVDLTDSQQQAITAIQRNTTYLWKSFVSLPKEKKSFICPIRQVTYQKIRKNLNTLCEAGFFEFNLIHENSGIEGSVIKVEVSEISDTFRAIIAHQSDQAHKPAPESTPVTPSRPRPPSSTKPLTVQNSPRPVALPKLALSRFSPSDPVDKPIEEENPAHKSGPRLWMIVLGILLSLEAARWLTYGTSSTTWMSQLYRQTFTVAKTPDAPKTPPILLAQRLPQTEQAPTPSSTPPAAPSKSDPVSTPLPVPVATPPPPTKTIEAATSTPIAPTAPNKTTPGEVAAPAPAPAPAPAQAEQPSAPPAASTTAPTPDPAPAAAPPDAEAGKEATTPYRPATAPTPPASESPEATTPTPNPLPPAVPAPLAVPGPSPIPTPAPLPVQNASRRLYAPVVFPHRSIRFPNDPEESTPLQAAPAQSTRIVMVDLPKLNLHSHPSFQGTRIKELNQGVNLTVHWGENGWLQVTDPTNTTGWVMAFATRDASTQQRITVRETFAPSPPRTPP